MERDTIPHNERNMPKKAESAELTKKNADFLYMSKKSCTFAVAKVLEL